MMSMNRILSVTVTAVLLFASFSQVTVTAVDTNFVFDDMEILCSEDVEGGSIIVSEKTKPVVTFSGVYDEDTAFMKWDINQSLKMDNVYILDFYAKTENTCANLTVDVGSQNHSATYPINNQLTRIKMPVTGINKIDSVIFSTDNTSQKISIGGIQLVDQGGANICTAQAGMYTIDDSYEKIMLTEDEALLEKSTAILNDGEYVYSVNSGTLTIFDVGTDNGLIKRSALTDLGNCRDMVICSDGKYLALSARENGVFMIDIQDKDRPKMLSNISTSELATGIDVCGNYLFSVNRVYGIDVYDISDPSNPKFCTEFSSNEEYYDCYVYDKYLYVSVWAQKKLYVYDLSDVYNPVEVAELKLNGKGGGLDVDNGYLYVSTGYDSQDKVSGIYSPGLGMGTGVDIFDISNPAEPIWVSSQKIDGRYQYGDFDHWKVNVSDGYAYVTSSYAGCMIIDVHNPASPKKVKSILGYIDKESSSFRKMNSGNYVFPYDQTKSGAAIFCDVAIGDGCIYIASSTNGIYTYDFTHAKLKTNEDSILTGTKRAEPAPSVMVDGYDVDQIYTDDAVYRIRAYNDKYYCAMSNGGINIYDKNFSLIKNYKTPKAVKDIYIADGKLYTAESANGIGIYNINNTGIEKIGEYVNDRVDRDFSALNVSDDGRYIFAQAGWTRFMILDASNPKNIEVLKDESRSTMYSRNMSCGFIDSKYISVADRQNIYWYNLKTGSGVSTTSTLKNTGGLYDETNGTAAYGKYALTIYNHGYIYYDPATFTNESVENLTIHKIPGIRLFRGKPSIGGNVLVASHLTGQQVTLVDISDIDNPKLISQFNVNGYPDFAEFDGNDILIPLRNGGILRLIKSN